MRDDNHINISKDPKEYKLNSMMKPVFVRLWGELPNVRNDIADDISTIIIIPSWTSKLIFLIVPILRLFFVNWIHSHDALFPLFLSLSPHGSVSNVAKHIFLIY